MRERLWNILKVYKCIIYFVSVLGALEQRLSMAEELWTDEPSVQPVASLHDSEAFSFLYVFANILYVFAEWVYLASCQHHLKLQEEMASSTVHTSTVPLLLWFESFVSIC